MHCRPHPAEIERGLAVFMTSSSSLFPRSGAELLYTCGCTFGSPALPLFSSSSFFASPLGRAKRKEEGRRRRKGESFSGRRREAAAAMHSRLQGQERQGFTFLAFFLALSLSRVYPEGRGEAESRKRKAAAAAESGGGRAALPPSFFSNGNIQRHKSKAKRV